MKKTSTNSNINDVVYLLLQHPELDDLARSILKRLDVSHCPPSVLIRSFLYSRYEIVSVEYTLNYLRQALQAVDSILAPWVRRELDDVRSRRKFESVFVRKYLKQIMAQHRIQVCGLNGSSPTYFGYANGWELQKKPQKFIVGQLRKGPRRVCASFRVNAKGKAERSDKLLFYQMPPHESLLAHMAAAAHTFWRVLAAIDGPSGSFNQAMADYAHRFLSAHPFETVNKSICISHINLFLILRGQYPIEQGFLDILVYQSSGPADAILFKKTYRKLTLEPESTS